MNIQKMKQNYAKVILGAGVDVKEGQLVLLQCPVAAADFAKIVAEEAYQMGAKDVYIDWTDAEINKLRYTYASEETLKNPPSFRYDMRKYFIDNSAALVTMNLVRTNEMEGVDARRVAMAQQATAALLAPANRFMFPNQCTFTSVCIPDQGWADIVFPGEENNLEKLWEKVAIATRCDQADPIGSWRQHLENVRRRGALLKEYNFKKLHYTNSIGTDLTFCLPEGHKWSGGGMAFPQKGQVFFPNLPTEEIFTAPDRLTVNGKVVSSMPLVENGRLINDFWFEFKDGKVVDYDAKEGKDALTAILNADETSCYLGEAALVQYDSPLSNLHTLFYTILFDENCSCHLALGNAYPNCLEGSRGQSPEWLMEHGLNVSKTHVDFMVGTKDLSIVGTDANGKEVAIFKDGNWAI